MLWGRGRGNVDRGPPLRPRGLVSPSQTGHPFTTHSHTPLRCSLRPPGYSSDRPEGPQSRILQTSPPDPRPGQGEASNCVTGWTGWVGPVSPVTLRTDLVSRLLG